jgi:hydroxymethylpyrimidine/phosphomethylpyrimidine kinase
MKTVLTIAGSDCSGGAGIQADIKTMTAHKVYAMSVITALTAQNTTGVYDIIEVTPSFVEKQLDCIFQDIRPDAIKIGMLSNADIIKSIVNKLKYYKAEKIVLDPVMVSTSGSQLLNSEAMETLMGELFELADIITPNLPETSAICGISIETTEDMLLAAKMIRERYQGSILIKGGHLKGTADDLLFADDKAYWLEEIKIENSNTHGTGCTLSSAIACNLALGYTIQESVKRAKVYITGALKDGLNLGKGSGPLNHSYLVTY